MVHKDNTTLSSPKEYKSSNPARANSKSIYENMGGSLLFLPPLINGRRSLPPRKIKTRQW
jgi:hypothetical protein